MQIAEKISIPLPSEVVKIIREKVGSGIYSSNSEVIREALRNWIECNQSFTTLDTAIARGLSDAKNGRKQDIETVRQELHGRFGS
ncbi:type II toxin-antitoxin system ParD family antitoxin [Methylotuvimicrobium buryatense]|uniref:Antitoxin ParD n=1 Tax=Methylotuvimicrobium buryatense TaxID=95641 RepID=A0A4P9UNQ9_METBY|nr:type II toxin-antitoxin system ParD family antitoxin [Methylotuvimicrobium buryatense]QCW81136.1 type II toxin-antitoxin system ParD family antitoxin [Methylotuvimicrobium buryatense]